MTRQHEQQPKRPAGPRHHADHDVDAFGSPQQGAEIALRTDRKQGLLGTRKRRVPHAQRRRKCFGKGPARISDFASRRSKSNTTKKASVASPDLLNRGKPTNSRDTESTASGAKNSSATFKIWSAPLPQQIQTWQPRKPGSFRQPCKLGGPWKPSAKLTLRPLSTGPNP